jgi:hypothetical protein
MKMIEILKIVHGLAISASENGHFVTDGKIARLSVVL